MIEPVDLAQKLSLVSEQWSPQVVARLNDYEVKIGDAGGAFTADHDDTLV